jgi:hypothetical protein
MAKEPIRKEAVAAAAIAAIAISYYMVDKNRRCKTFKDVWSDPDPLAGLNLTEEVIEDAYSWTKKTLRSIILAQETPNKEIIHQSLADYIADCDWEESRKTKKGRQVWTSLGKIVDGTMAEYAADPVGFMKNG